MILVDFSGTIVDFKSTVKKAFREFSIKWFRDQGFDGSPEELRDALRQTAHHYRDKEYNTSLFVVDVGRRLDTPISPEKAREEWDLFHDYCVINVKLVDDALEGLQALSELDELVLYTNGEERMVLPTLERFGLKELFSRIVCLGGKAKYKKTKHDYETFANEGAWAIVGDTPSSDGLGEDFGITFLDIREGWDKVVEKAKRISKQ